MRILWLSHLVPYPPKGGVLQRAYFMLKELAKYHEVDLLAFNQEDLIAPMFSSVEEGLEEARAELLSFCDDLQIFEIESVRGSLGRYGLAMRSLIARDPYSIEWLKSPKFANAIRNRVTSGEYDLIHFDTISLVPFKHFAGNTPTVLDHHNIESHMLVRRASNEKSPLKKWYFRQEGRRLGDYEKEWCRQFSLNIVCSDVDGERLREIMPEGRISVVPNGVDTDFFLPAADVDEQLSLIFVGTMNWYPNVEAVRFIAFRLWPALKKEIPGIVIDVVGANPPPDLVKFAETETDFRVHGFVDDILPMIDRASVYLCPIMDGGGTKLKILDALSMQKAIVAHAVACEGINVTDGHDVVLAERPGEFVYAVKRLIADSSYRAMLGRNARELAQSQYSYKRIGEELSSLFIEVVDQHEAQSG